MPEITERLQLHLPLGNEYVKRESSLNDIFKEIDKKVAIVNEEGKVPVEDVTGLEEEIKRIDTLEQDFETHKADSTKHVSNQERERWNGTFRTSRLQKDTNGTYQTIEKKRTDGTLFAKSVFSNPDTNGNWLVRTYTEYAADGITVISKVIFDLVYDSDGDWVNEVPR